MVRLIRLNSSNDNAEFDANINTDVILKKDAQIAVRNCSFEPKYSNFVSNVVSGALNIKPNIAEVDTSHNLQYVREKTFPLHDSGDLFYETTYALNLGLGLRENVDDAKAIQNGSEFRVNYQIDGDTDNAAFEYRYAPCVTFNDVYCGLSGTGIAIARYSVTSDAPNNLIQTDGAFDNLIKMDLPTGTARTTTEKYRVMTGASYSLSKGSGWYAAQIEKLSAGAGDEGFGIGLSFGQNLVQFGGVAEDNIQQHPDENEIPTTLRNLELGIRKNTDNYVYRATNKGVASTGDIDSGIGCDLTGGGITGNASSPRNDILIFKMDTIGSVKVIKGSVIQYNGGVGSTTVIFTHTLTKDELQSSITPYIYIREDDSKVQLRNVCFTLSPYLNATKIIGGPTPANFAILPGYDYIIADATRASAELVQFLPSQNELRFSDLLNVTVANLVFTSVVMDQSLYRLLGFDINPNQVTPIGTLTMNLIDFGVAPAFLTTNGVTYFYGGNIIRAPNEPKILAEEDCYIIELQDIALESYNSQTRGRYQSNFGNQHSEGARKNILDVIPISSKPDMPKIEYTPNEMVFCNILNSENMNIRNMKLRIIDGDFQNVRTHGESEILLVIKD
jgi:hypothetical protein